MKSGGALRDSGSLLISSGGAFRNSGVAFRDSGSSLISSGSAFRGSGGAFRNWLLELMGCEIVVVLDGNFSHEPICWQAGA